MISNPGRRFHMMPSSRLNDPTSTLFEKRRFGCSARKTHNLARKRFSKRTGPFLEFWK